MRPGPFAVAVLLAAHATMPGAAPTPPLAAAAQTLAPPPPDAALQQRLARVRDAVFTGSRRPNELIAELKAILAIDPALAEAHVLLALAYRSIGSNDMLAEAVAEFRQALALDSRLATARFYLANAYLDLGRAERAREELELALAQVPDQPQFTTLLAEAERRSGNPERGLQLAQQVLTGDASAAQARYYAAMSLLDLNRRAEAIVELEQLARTGAAMDIAGNLGTLYLEDGRLDDAVTMLTMAANAAPGRPDFRVSLARAYRLRGMLTEAQEQLDLALPPGAHREASEFYETVDADVRLETAVIRLQQDRLDDALAELEQALALRPAHGLTHRYLAEAYMRQGRTELAIAHATQAREAGETLPDALSALLPAAPSTTKGQE